jgi:hypothetical protein
MFMQNFSSLGISKKAEIFSSKSRDFLKKITKFSNSEKVSNRASQNPLQKFEPSSIFTKISKLIFFLFYKKNDFFKKASTNILPRSYRFYFWNWIAKMWRNSMQNLKNIKNKLLEISADVWEPFLEKKI